MSSPEPGLDEVLRGWTADGDHLAALLFSRIPRSGLAQIAGADYGDRADQHLAALLAYQAGAPLPSPIPWCPHEVLSLWRWHDEADPLSRALATAVLLAEAVQSGELAGHQPTLAVCIDSCMQLEEPCLGALMELLIELVRAEDSAESMHLFGLLGVLIVGAAIDPDDPRLPALADWLEGAEPVPCPERYLTPEHGWLLGTTFFDQQHQRWRGLARSALEPAGAPEVQRVRGRLLSGGS